MTEELNEKFSPMQIKQAIGIASDKRYAGGNMTGATKAIDKLARGLSDHPQVRAVLKRMNEKFDPADFDLVATDKDKASAKMNIIMQLRKSMDVRGNLPIKFADGKSQKVPMNVIKIALDKFAGVRKPASKEKMQTAMSKSYKDMIMTLKSFKESVDLEEGVDKAKVKKQIDQAQKYMKTFFGNTSAVKMKKFAIQKKIDKLQGQLKEEAQLDKALNEAPRPPKISKGKAKGSISASGMRGKGNKKFDVTVNFDNGKFSFRITDESGRFQTVGLKQASKMLGEEVINELVESKMAGWVAIYNGKKVEIKKSEANDLYGAKMKAAKMLKVPKSKMGLLAIKPGYNEDVVNEEVQQDLQEAPAYKLHHNTFSAAVQEAIAVAKKAGYEVDMDDWSDKVATGPKKPSKDKTNRYSVKLLKGGKPTRKFLQIQVYNMGSKYELNCYVQ